MSIPLSQRLKSRKAIQRLMADGEHSKAYPIRMVYGIRHNESEPGLRLAVSVPKRLHAHAVDRNLMKRRIKEAYAKTSTDLRALIVKKGVRMDVMLIYTSAEKLDMSELRPKIILLFERLHSRISNPS